MANISGYLNTIESAARGEDVRDTIINCLNAINKDNPNTIKPLNVTANGTYAGEGGVVYNPITVNVPGGVSNAIALVDISITENGETNAPDGQAYKTITVDVPQYENEILSEITITQNGDYVALLDGYDGYGTVHVDVQQGGTGSFTVNFYDKDRVTILQTVTGVPAGGGAIYYGPNPTSSGMRFVGWTPNPQAIYADTNCYPRFENIVYSDEQITDDWVTIAKNIRKDPDSYAIGQWKLLELRYVGRTLDDKGDVSFSRYLKFMLVAKGVDPMEGENGYASSTWISIGPGYGNYTETQYPKIDTTGSIYGFMTYNGYKDIYPQDRFRNYLNNIWYHYLMPEELRPYVRNVIKYTYGKDELSVIQDQYTSIEAVWVPSYRELIGVYPDSTKIETYGPIYDSYFGISERNGSFNDNEARIARANGRPDLFTFKDKAFNYCLFRTWSSTSSTTSNSYVYWKALHPESITIDDITYTVYTVYNATYTYGNNCYSPIGFCI